MQAGKYLTILKLQAIEYLGPEEIFKGESDEALTKIRYVIKVLEKFKEDFEEKRNTLQTYFKDAEFVPWEFASSLVFPRYNCFLGRVRQLEVNKICCCLQTSHICVDRI